MPADLRHRAALRALDGLAGDARRAGISELLPGSEEATNGFLIEIGVKPAPAQEAAPPDMGTGWEDPDNQTIDEEDPF